MVHHIQNQKTVHQSTHTLPSVVIIQSCVIHGKGLCCSFILLGAVALGTKKKGKFCMTEKPSLARWLTHHRGSSALPEPTFSRLAASDLFI